MIGKAVAVLLLAAAAPAADTNVRAVPVTLPDYGDGYDMSKDLAPLIPLCVAAMASDDPEFLEKVFDQSNLPPQGRRRIAEVCITFQLGAFYILREMDSEEGGPAATSLSIDNEA